MFIVFWQQQGKTTKQTQKQTFAHATKTCRVVRIPGSTSTFWWPFFLFFGVA